MVSAGRGFTLIELLAVLAIIATLLTLAAPRYFASVVFQNIPDPDRVKTRGRARHTTKFAFQNFLERTKRRLEAATASFEFGKNRADEFSHNLDREYFAARGGFLRARLGRPVSAVSLSLVLAGVALNAAARASPSSRTSSPG